MSHDLMRCAECGKDFDPAQLDQLLFHEGGHQLREATGIVGVKVTPGPRCSACGRLLEPAAARAEGEPTTVGYQPCPEHLRARPVYATELGYERLLHQRLDALHREGREEGIIGRIGDQHVD